MSFTAYIVRQYCDSIPQNLLGDRLAYRDCLVFARCAIECEDQVIVELIVLREKDRAMLRRYNFEKQLKQTLLKLFDSTNGIDPGADFHQRTQVTSHQVERIIKPNLNS